MKTKTVCLIVAVLLAAFALIQQDDSREQKIADLEYCEMIEMGAWGSYKPEVDCPKVMGEVKL